MLDFKKAQSLIGQAMIIDQFAFIKKLQGLNKVADKNKNIHFLDTDFQKKLFDSVARRAARTIDAKISFPPELPVSQKVEEIKKLIKENQVIIIAGETGSGKSTQLPKICLELGLGQAGMIGHTQPRRIAARTLASRISDELALDMPDVEKNALVACKVRFSDSVKETTQIKLMTDGMLLAEIKNDFYLNQYQCLIIDEAHERSLNIDFLLGFLKRLILKRKDLKVIITSATIDVNKLSNHFSDAPIIEVSGRNFPVNIHYLDDLHESDSGRSQSINEDFYLAHIIEKIIANEFSEQVYSLAQDILIFLATENEIRQYSKSLRQCFQKRLDVLPLYGRMPLSQQREIFSSKSNKRRIILASNVAETSVTVPNIGFVVDFGLARISRYNTRTKIQQLPIEKISQASANQRAGRCGRIAPGVCIRLYSEADFVSRDAFTQPEIQRTNLSAVILQMESLKLGRIEKFPLLDMPDHRLIKDAYKLLFELEAIDSQEKLTAIGKKMASLALDPRFSRMLLEADKQNCLEEILIIVCGLSINEPRQRPQDNQQQADLKHASFKVKKSDFLSYYKLWHLLEHKRRILSNSQFRKYCEQNYIAWNGIREWREMHRQTLLQIKSNRLVNARVIEKEFDEESFKSVIEDNKENEFLYTKIHKSLLKGLLSQVAHIDEGFAYQGVHRKQLYIFPTSVLMKQKSSWIMAAQLIETSRLYAHCCAEIHSQWIIEQGSYLLNKKFSDAFYSKKQGAVQAYQQLSLGSLIIEARKPVKATTAMEVELSVELQSLFIQGALIERRYIKPPYQLLDNWKVLDDIHQLEQKLRRVDLLPDDYALLDFYRSRIPNHVIDTRSFEHWLKKQNRNVIVFDDDFLRKNKASDDVLDLFPDKLPNARIEIPCDYVFNPLLEDDGLNISLRFDQLNQVNQQTLDWLVPGLIKEKCEALLKALPKSLRKQCLPIQDTVDACLQGMDFGQGDLLLILAKELTRKVGISVKKQDFQLDKLPKHLRCHVSLVDEQGKLIAKAWDVETLRQELHEKMKTLEYQTLSSKQSSNNNLVNQLNNVEQEVQLKAWDFGDIEETVFFEKVSLSNQESYQIKMYSALQDCGEYVKLIYANDKDEANLIHSFGQRRLMALSLSALKRDLKKEFKNLNLTALKLFSAGDASHIFEDLFLALINQVFFIDKQHESIKTLPTMVYCKNEFEERLVKGKGELYQSAQLLFDVLMVIAEKTFELRKNLRQPGSALKMKHLAWIEAHLLDLIRPGFLKETPLPMLLRYPFYLDALQARIDRLQGNIDRDQNLQILFDELRLRFKPCREAYLHFTSELFLKREKLALTLEFACLFEEFVMSQFTQNKKTIVPVSRKILEQKLLLLEV